MRVVLTLFLALTLALSSVPQAMARHLAPAVGLAELCTGAGVVAVALDAQGNPTGRHVPCPDCTPALAALGHAPVTVARPVLRLVPLAWVAPQGAVIAPTPTRPWHARAPPARA